MELRKQNTEDLPGSLDAHASCGVPQPKAAASSWSNQRFLQGTDQEEDDQLWAAVGGAIQGQKVTLCSLPSNSHSQTHLHHPTILLPESSLRPDLSPPPNHTSNIPRR